MTPKCKFNTEIRLIEMCYSEIYFWPSDRVFTFYLKLISSFVFFCLLKHMIRIMMRDYKHGLALHGMVYTLCLTRTCGNNGRILTTVLFSFYGFNVLYTISITIVFFPTFDVLTYSAVDTDQYIQFYNNNFLLWCRNNCVRFIYKSSMKKRNRCMYVLFWNCCTMR